MDLNSELSTTSDARESQPDPCVLRSILRLDMQVSMHIGRPLAARVKPGTVCLTVGGMEGVRKDVEQSKLDFTLYALEVLTVLCAAESDLVGRTYEELEELVKLERLQLIEERLRQISRDLEREKLFLQAAKDHEIELYAFKMMVHCTLSKSAQQQRGTSSEKHNQPRKIKPCNMTAHRPSNMRQNEAYPHQTTILASARSILDSFANSALILGYDRQANWDSLFNTYCAVATLSIAVLREETKLASDTSMIRATASLFQKLSNKNPQCHLSHVATRRLGDLVDEIEKANRHPVEERLSRLEESVACSPAEEQASFNDPWDATSGRSPQRNDFELSSKWIKEESEDSAGLSQQRDDSNSTSVYGQQPDNSGWREASETLVTGQTEFDIGHYNSWTWHESHQSAVDPYSYMSYEAPVPGYIQSLTPPAWLSTTPTDSQMSIPTLDDWQGGMSLPGSSDSDVADHRLSSTEGTWWQQPIYSLPDDTMALPMPAMPVQTHQSSFSANFPDPQLSVAQGHQASGADSMYPTAPKTAATNESWQVVQQLLKRERPVVAPRFAAAPDEASSAYSAENKTSASGAGWGWPSFPERGGGVGKPQNDELES